MMQWVNTSMGATTALDADAELMLRVRDGDGACFAQLLEKHRSSVVHFLYRMVQDFGVAEELGQEVFLRVYRSRESYEPTAKFTTWLYRIATHLALNSIRDNKKERGQDRIDAQAEGAPALQVSDRKPTVETEMLHDVKRAEVRDAIRRLPEKQRAAVLMHKYDEMEYSQIAAILSLSESAVKSLLFRAYESLRARLAHMA